MTVLPVAGSQPIRPPRTSYENGTVRDLQKKVLACVDASQEDRVVITRHGRPAAVLVGSRLGDRRVAVERVVLEAHREAAQGADHLARRDAQAARHYVDKDDEASWDAARAEIRSGRVSPGLDLRREAGDRPRELVVERLDTAQHVSRPEYNRLDLLATAA